MKNERYTAREVERKKQRLKFHKCNELHNNGSNVLRHNSRPTLLKLHTTEARFGGCMCCSLSFFFVCVYVCLCLSVHFTMKRDKQELFTRAKWIANNKHAINLYECVLPLNALYHSFFFHIQTDAYTRKSKQNEWMRKKSKCTQNKWDFERSDYYIHR